MKQASDTTAAARAAFGARLRAALDCAGHAATAELVHAELRQCRGSDTVTIFAVRKWLAGEAIPTQPSVRLLAQWLRVAPGSLRFGPLESTPAAAPEPALRATLRRLSDSDHRMVVEFVSFLLLKNRG
ncbi:hypothetical protein [Massilia sp. DWR3-1-1]|uniref:hypothetical protein n=1 Tax=Massilia sp. DWR3-1-1 TaxID=2804559 RepID=UPI003CF962E7